MKKKIAIFCGGPSSEHEVSINSAKTIFQYIDKEKYKIVLCFISKNLKAEIIENPNVSIEKIEPSLSLSTILKKLKQENYFALLAGIHGEFAEDGKLQKLLKDFKIKYSGTKILASKLCMDKFNSLKVVKKISDLSFPETFKQTVNTSSIPKQLHYPFVVKPNSLGSSVGVHIVRNKKEFIIALSEIKKRKNVKDILLQEYISDAVEISCGCLEKKNGEFIELPPIEIVPHKSNLFDYASKYELGGSEEITPPISLSKKTSKKISELSISIHKILGCKTYSRSDFRVKGEKIYYLETNTLPGMTTTSLLPKEAKAAGIEFPKLIEFIIENA